MGKKTLKISWEKRGRFFKGTILENKSVNLHRPRGRPLAVIAAARNGIKLWGTDIAGEIFINGIKCLFSPNRGWFEATLSNEDMQRVLGIEVKKPPVTSFAPPAPRKTPDPVDSIKLSLRGNKLHLEAEMKSKDKVILAISTTGGHYSDNGGYAKNGKFAVSLDLEDNCHGEAVRGWSRVFRHYLDQNGKQRSAKSRTRKSDSCMIIKKNGKWHLKYFQGWDLSQY